jgi:hypothetical protein
MPSPLARIYHIESVIAGGVVLSSRGGGREEKTEPRRSEAIWPVSRRAATTLEPISFLLWPGIPFWGILNHGGVRMG